MYFEHLLVYMHLYDFCEIIKINKMLITFP